MSLLTIWETLTKTTLRMSLSMILMTITAIASFLIMISILKTCTISNTADSLDLLISIKTMPTLATTFSAGSRASLRHLDSMVSESTPSLKSSHLSGSNTPTVLVCSLLVKSSMAISDMLLVSFLLLDQCWTIPGTSISETYSWTKKTCGLLEFTTAIGQLRMWIFPS